MNTLEINKDFLDSLFAKAKENPRCARTMIFVQVQRIKAKECSMLCYLVLKWRYIVIRIHQRVSSAFVAEWMK